MSEDKEKKPAYKRSAPEAEAKVEKVEAPVKKESKIDIEKKAAAIRDSKMPELQKEAYLRKIGALKADDVDVKAVPLAVWVSVRKKDRGMLSAYAAYPRAKSVRLATPKEWDEIFKDF